MLILLFFRTLGVLFLIAGIIALSDYLVSDSQATPLSPATLASGIILLVFGILLIFATAL